MAPLQEAGNFEAVGNQAERTTQARSTDGLVAAESSVEVFWEMENTSEQAPAIDGHYCTD